MRKHTLVVWMAWAFKAEDAAAETTEMFYIPKS